MTDFKQTFTFGSKLFAWLLSLSLFFFIFFEFFLNLTPPISRDAIIHHLAIPKLWIQHGGFYEIPWADFSYFPMNINLLYVVPLLFKIDIIPKFIHMAFALATGWLIFSYLKRKYDKVWGLLGAFIFLSTPITIWLSTSAYIDLGMTFFTTASVLGFIRWRESNYGDMKWFFLAAFAMGLAVGSKYNALMAWFITNLLIMVIYVRDEDTQIEAIKYGVLFFIITVVVASPWYLKNYILTGNPFFPLFKSFFKSLYSAAPVGEIVNQSLEKGGKGSVGFFQLRGYVYGESFWETLAIPIRMFFQGEDNSYQYFQGKLNPILILFLPFAFLKEKARKNNFLFLTFCLFFMIMAFFLTAKQVRYQLPVLPFLSILAVVGIKNVADLITPKKSETPLKTGRKAFHYFLSATLFVSVTLLLFGNVKYLKERFDIIRPVPYLLGQESKEDFLKRHLSHYNAVAFMNAYLPEDAVVFTIYFGRRGYYLNRSYFNHPSFGTTMLKRWVKQAADEEKFLQSIQKFDATHIAMRSDLVNKYLQNNFSQQEALCFIELVRKHWRMIYSENGYAVWEIKTPNISIPAE